MTDLDDALDTSTPLYAEPTIRAAWEELPPGYATDVPKTDDLGDLGQQLSDDGWSCNHSLIDGLPQAVTMTTTNDGSGQLEASLIGRAANIADTWGWRTAASGTGSGTSVTIANPTGIAPWDYQFVGIAFNNSTSVPVDVNADPTNRWAWQLLGSAVDGAVKVWVWGRRYYTGAPDLQLSFASASYSWTASAVWALTAGGTWVGVKPGSVVTYAAASAVTSHPLPAQTLKGRGWGLGFWATAAATAQFTTTDTELIEAAAVVDLMMARTATQPGPRDDVFMTATTSSSNGTVAGIGIPLVVMDRPHMDAKAYFSPFKTDSPVYGWQRDTADVNASVNVVGANGLISTPIFKGQMVDIPVSGSSRNGDLQAVSRTRVLLDKVLTLPNVDGRREGCTIDYLVTWLMAHGGQYAGPGPSDQTRIWAPMYGSVHSFNAGPLEYSTADQYTTDDPGVYYRIQPTEIPGPFVSAMDARFLDDDVVGLRLNFDRILPTTVPGVDYPELNDFMSTANNIGRLTFWIRGDVATSTPAALVGSPNAADDEWLMRYRLAALSNIADASGGTNKGGVTIQIDPVTRNIVLFMGSQVGYQTQTLTGNPLPADGQWHFIGIAWDWATGLIKARMDNFTWSTSGWTTVDSALAPTEQHLYEAGGFVFNQMRSHLPMSDVQVETGPNVYTEGFTRFWPAPTPNATYRRSGQPIVAIADPTPVGGWDTIGELAVAATAAYRVNEDDNFEFLPLPYFSEPEQITPVTVQDTEVNTSALDVELDATKLRNVITLQFQDTTIDSSYTTVLALTQSTEIPAGVTYWTFSLELPTVELNGLANAYVGTTWDLQWLNASQIGTPSTIPASIHYMTVNAKADGSGSVMDFRSLKGRIISYDLSTVTIRFTNYTGKSVYLANSGTDVPVMRILGYSVRMTDAWVTTRDSASLLTRRERATSHENRWLQTRSTALEVAGRIASIVSVPRPEVTIVAMGDPRRKPGQLVELADSQGTAAQGLWRIMSVQHVGSGPRYTTQLHLAKVGDVMIWDGEPGWDLGVWGE